LKFLLDRAIPQCRSVGSRNATTSHLPLLAGKNMPPALSGRGLRCGLLPERLDACCNDDKPG